MAYAFQCFLLDNTATVSAWLCTVNLSTAVYGQEIILVTLLMSMGE